MDFYAMKRKRLQKLCQKHGIRANLKNVEMAERLTLLLKEDEKPITEVQSVEKNLEATEIVIDSVESQEVKKVKKVKFSPDNETFYFVATDKDSDSDCDYNQKKKSVGKRKSIGKKVSTKQQVPVVENAIEHEVVEIKETPVRVTRSRAQEMVAGDAEPIFSPLPGPKKVITGAENVAGKGVKPVKVQKQCKAIVVQKGKELARDDTRKRTRNQDYSGASQVVPSVETTVENEVLPKPPLRRSRRKTALFSSTAAAEKELGICEAVKLAREPVNRKSSNATEPGRRSGQNACKKVPAETCNDIIATGVEMDGLMKEMLEPSLVKESSLVVCESLPVLQMGKELERDVTRKRPWNSLQLSTESVLCAEINSPLQEEPKIVVGLGVLEAAGNENDADSCCNKEAVEKSIKKRKGSSKKRESAAKNQPFSFAESAVYSDIEKTKDISAHMNGNQLLESVINHMESATVEPVVNHMESGTVEHAISNDSTVSDMIDPSCLSYDRKDTDQENLVEKNPAESPDKLSSEVSLSFTSVQDVESLTNQPECEGKASNLLDFNEGLETKELLIVKTINRRSGVLDDHLADGVIASVYEDQKSIDKNVLVQVDVDSKKLAETGTETVGEMHLGRIFPSDTSLTPSNSSPVKQACCAVGNQFQAQSACVTEVPDENSSSWNAEMLCYRDRTEEVIPADNESLKALDISQIIPTGTEEVVHPDLHNTDGQVADVKLPEGVLHKGVEGLLHGSNNHNLSFDEFIVLNDHIVEPTVNSNHECAMDTAKAEIELASPVFFVEKLSDENQSTSSKDSNIVVSEDSEVRVRASQSALQLDHMNYGDPDIVELTVKSNHECAMDTAKEEIELASPGYFVKKWSDENQSKSSKDSNIVVSVDSECATALQLDHMNSGDPDIVELTVKSNHECAMDTAKEEIELASPGFFVEKLSDENQSKSSKDLNIVVLADSEVRERASQSAFQLDHMNSGDPDLCEEVASYKDGNASMNDNIKTLDGGTENRMMGSKADMEDDVTPTENNNIGDCLIGGDLVDLNSYDHGQVDIASINDSTVVILSADNSTKQQVCSGDLYGLDDCSKDDENDAKRNVITEEERDVNAAFEEDEENKEEATSKERTEELFEVLKGDLYGLDDCSKDDKNDARKKEITDEDRAFEEDEENEEVATSKEHTEELFDVQKADLYGLDDCSKDDKNDVRKKEITDEDIAFEEDEENKGEATSKEHTEELFDVQKGVAEQDAAENSDGPVEVNLTKEQGVAEQDAAENLDGPVEVYFTKEQGENAMDAGDNIEILESDDHPAEEPILEDNERLNEQDIVSAMIQEYEDCEKDRNEYLEVKNLNISSHEARLSETAHIAASGFADLGDLVAQNMIISGVEEKCRETGGAKNNVACAMNSDIVELGKFNVASLGVSHLVANQMSSQLDNCASAASSDSISRDDKTAERIAYAWKMGEESSSMDISSTGHENNNDAADIICTGGMETIISMENSGDGSKMVEKTLIRSDGGCLWEARNTSDVKSISDISCSRHECDLSSSLHDVSVSCKDLERRDPHMQGDHASTYGFGSGHEKRDLLVQEGSELGMLEGVSGLKVDEGLVAVIYRSGDSMEPSMLKPEMGVDSPVTASNVEKEALVLDFASPVFNSFGMKGLFKDDQTSGVKKSDHDMSKGNSKSEYIEDVKKGKESIGNSQVVAGELRDWEHKVIEEVVELKSTQEMGNLCHIVSAVMDRDVHIPSFRDDSTEVEQCTDNSCAKPQTCSGGAIASVFNLGRRDLHTGVSDRDSLIPRTPKSLINTSDMKENLNSRKSEQFTKITAAKPLQNRRALEDLQNK